MKRYLICLMGGFIAAALCIMGIMFGKSVDWTPSMILATAGNRILIGFVLGISGWKVNWAWHGLMIGLIVSLASAVAILPNWMGFTAYTAAGMFYGFLIELTATKLLDQPVQS